MCNIYKKHFALLAMFMVLTFSTFAQMKMMADTMRPFSGDKAFRHFSVGVNAGALSPTVATGGSNDFTNPKVDFGYGANIKYQFTHLFALQGEFYRGKVKGDQSNKLSNGAPAFPGNRRVYAFENDLHYAASLLGIFTFNNINWLKRAPRFVPYLGAGGGIASFDVKYATTVTNSPSIKYPANSPIRDFYVTAAAGIKYMLSSSVNLDLGYRANYVDADNFDGVNYFNTFPNPSRQLHKDKFAYGFLGVEFSLGSKARPQLMFDNPAYRTNSNLQNQIDVLRSQLNLADTDGDGVADIFDKEPNTPAGCPVDSHGVTKDTDGDGVPDCKDQQLITPTECQPVDANGVGKCPPPECCSRIATGPAPEKDNNCTVGDLPSLSFKGNGMTLSADTKSILATVASKLKESPNCGITITGYPAASKASQAVCNKRTDAVKMFLMNNEGISSDRISVNCQTGGGDANTIDIKASTK